jgi:hypothetical protein
LHVPAGDLDLVDDEAEKGLLLLEVEVVEGCDRTSGEVGDAAAQLVVAGQLFAFGGEAVASFSEVTTSSFDVGGTALHVGQIDQSGLVEVDQSAALGFGGVELAVEPSELGGQQFVIGGRGTNGECLFTGEQRLGSGERGPDLVEDELVEDVGADVAFRAASILAAGSERVMVAAVVIAVPGAVAAAHLVAVGAYLADAALDQAAQQPVPGFGASRAPLGVVPADPSRGLEGVLVHQCGHRDGDPFLAGTGNLPCLALGLRVRHYFCAVEEDPADVGLVAQYSA